MEERTWCNKCDTCDGEHETFEEGDYTMIYICSRCKLEFGEYGLDEERCPKCHCKRWLSNHTRCDCEYNEREHFEDDYAPPWWEFEYKPGRYFRCDCGGLMPIGLKDSIEPTEDNQIGKTCCYCYSTNQHKLTIEVHPPKQM